MSARPSKVPNWGQGGRGRFLREGGGFRGCEKDARGARGSREGGE